MIYDHLNHQIPSNTPGYSDAWRRVLNRLGEYTEAIAHSLKMFPTRVELLQRTDKHILIRIHMPNEYVVLRIAPENNLAGEAFFAKTMTRNNLPVPRIIHYDAGRSLVPFAYIIEGYIGGLDGNELQSSALLQGVARQAGRTLRRVHRIEAPGWGYPELSGQWKANSWFSVLQSLSDFLSPKPVATTLFGEDRYNTITAILKHLSRTCADARLMHGNVGPQAARCTVSGQQVRLEALINPGKVVGGDGLLDLASGMVPVYPQEWIHGLFEGYVALTPLTIHELEVLRCWQVITCYWSTCQHYFMAEPYDYLLDQTLLLLADVHETSIEDL